MKNKIIASLVFCVLLFTIVINYLTFKFEIKKRIIFSQKTGKARFTKIYDLGYWVENSSGGISYTAIFNKKSGPSGVGALKQNSIPYLEYLQNFITTNYINTIIDLGCGDFMLMKHIHLPENIKYLGIDIVDELIKNNSKLYSKKNIKFEKIDSLENAIQYNADLLIIKDVMQFWTIEQIHFFIEKILPNYKYAIIVNNFYPVENQKKQNANTIEGESRPINLEIAPFFMKIKVIKDYFGGNRYKRIYLYINNKNKK